jgi:hypothetical protein
LRRLYHACRAEPETAAGSVKILLRHIRLRR